MASSSRAVALSARAARSANTPERTTTTTTNGVIATATVSVHPAISAAIHTVPKGIAVPRNSRPR